MGCTVHNCYIRLITCDALEISRQREWGQIMQGYSKFKFNYGKVSINCWRYKKIRGKLTVTICVKYFSEYAYKLACRTVKGTKRDRASLWMPVHSALLNRFLIQVIKWLAHQRLSQFSVKKAGRGRESSWRLAGARAQKRLVLRMIRMNSSSLISPSPSRSASSIIS